MQPNQDQLLRSTNNAAIRIYSQGALLPDIINPETRSIAIREVSKAVNFDLILTQTSEPPLKVSASRDEISVLKSIYFITFEFIASNYPDSLTETVAETFARDILELNPTWSILDVIHFFKWIRFNQGDRRLKVYGNKINVLALLEIASYYNEDRVTAHERLLTQVKDEEFKPDRDRVDFKRDSKFYEELSQLGEDYRAGRITAAERTRRYGILVKRDRGAAEATDQERKQISDLAEVLGKRLTDENERKKDERAEYSRRAIKYHKDNDFCISWLKERRNLNEISTEGAIIWFNLFTIRKY